MTNNFVEQEESNFKFLETNELNFGMLRLTETGLQKSILDATRSFRDFLRANGIHDFDAQDRGPEHKRVVDTVQISTHGSLEKSSASLYRSKTRADPRVSFAEVKKYFYPGDLLVGVFWERRFWVVNASRVDLSTIGVFLLTRQENPAEALGSSRWDILGGLWDRATGGNDVAAHPATDEKDLWGKAPRPAGVDEATDWLQAGLEEAGLPRYLFLVGGPGAGKSHAAAAVASKLTEIEPRNDGLAHRTYDYVSADRQTLRIVNDATIRSTKQTDGALVEDIAYATRQKGNLLACVNRGILVEEVAISQKKESMLRGPGDAILAWIQNSVDVGHGVDLEWNVVEQHRKAFLRVGSLTKNGSEVAHMIVVFVDVCSLFEKRPHVEIVHSSSRDVELYAADYAVTSFEERAEWATDETPAGSLLTRVLEKIGGGDSDVAIEFDPIQANHDSLKSSSVRTGIMSILRASEIVASQRMTYREVWGSIVRCFVGEAPEMAGREELKEMVLALQPQTDDARERFRAMQKLAGLRFSQTIYGLDQHLTGRIPDPLRNPVTRLTSGVDPVKDSIPGFYKGRFGTGWATPIADAFAGPVISSSPLESLLEDLEGSEDGFLEVVTDFDRAVDAAFVRLTNSPELSDSERYRFISWYGGYLTRLYATANGIPAFSQEVSAWTLAWVHSPNLTPTLKSQLSTLLRPARDPNTTGSASLIPLFDSRTDPIIGQVTSPKLGLRLGEVELRTITQGENISLTLREEAKTVGEVSLDFALVREAMAAIDGRPGLTELSDTTSPRLERYRSARLVPQRLDQASYCVVTGNEEALLTVGKR